MIGGDGVLVPCKPGRGAGTLDRFEGVANGVQGLRLERVVVLIRFKVLVSGLGFWYREVEGYGVKGQGL